MSIGRDPAPGEQPVPDPDVQRVVERLRVLDELPVAEHAAVYEAAHDALRDALASTATSEGPPVS